MRMTEQMSPNQDFDKEKKIFHVFVYIFYCTCVNFFMDKTPYGGAADSALARITDEAGLGIYHIH